MREKTAIIVGAGPAGLTAAYQLLKTTTDIRPVILESEDFVGGISRTASYKGNRMDIGGHRFFSKDDRVRRLWKELLPVQGAPAFDDELLGKEKPLQEGGPDPKQTEEVMLVRDRVSRIIYKRKFYDYPLTIKASTFLNLGFCTTVRAGCGYLGSCIKKREETNLENFYINRFGKPLYSMFFEDYTEKLWGVHPKNIAADWGTQRVKGLSISKALKNALLRIFRPNHEEKETSLISEFLYPKKGPGQLYEKMAAEILRMGGEIHLQTTVHKIELSEGKIGGMYALNALGEEKFFQGDYYFSSMPVKDLLIAVGKEKVPQEVYGIGTALPYRDFMTVGVLLNKLKVQNKTKKKTLGNIIPDCWIYVQDRDVKLGRIQVFNNWSPYMVEDPEHTVWVGLEYFCDEGDSMWTSPDEDFIQNAVRELVKIGFIESEREVLDSTLLRVKKAYPAYFGSYERFDEVKAWLNTIDNLYCIGRNGQHRYNNMDHSMLTAMVACEAIAKGGEGKAEVWEVNTDQEYHEEQKEG